jgi:hypothetical protein
VCCLSLSIPQFAYKFGSGDAPRAWSKYTAGSSAHAKLGATIMTGANDVPLGAAAGEARKERDSRKEKKKGRGPLEEEGGCCRSCTRLCT